MNININKIYAQKLKEKTEWKLNGCLEWNGHQLVNQGYGVLDKNILAHRWVYEQTQGKIPEGMIVRHKCDNPPCCNPKHLLLGTHVENMQDKAQRNRNINIGNTKLNREKVLDIKQKYQLYGNIIIKELSSHYNVSISAIKNIIYGKTWKNIFIEKEIETLLPIINFTKEDKERIKELTREYSSKRT